MYLAKFDQKFHLRLILRSLGIFEKFIVRIHAHLKIGLFKYQKEGSAVKEKMKGKRKNRHPKRRGRILAQYSGFKGARKKGLLCLGPDVRLPDQGDADKPPDLQGIGIFEGELAFIGFAFPRVVDESSLPEIFSRVNESPNDIHAQDRPFPLGSIGILPVDLGFSGHTLGVIGWVVGFFQHDDFPTIFSFTGINLDLGVLFLIPPFCHDGIWLLGSGR
jgi:hypothetical protein